MATKAVGTASPSTAKSKVIKTTIENIEVAEELHETVTLTETYANHGSIVTRHGVIEFDNGQATVSKELAVQLRKQGLVM